MTVAYQRAGQLIPKPAGKPFMFLYPPAKRRQDLAAALDWTVRCLALFERFPKPAAGRGPSHLARLTAELGLPAHASTWKGQTGWPLLN